MRDEFTKKTKVTLAQRVGYKCSNPNCKKLTSGPNKDENKSTSIGVAAHISAASKGGPRFTENLTPEERKNISNGIWLCQNCSVVIDKDELRFSSDLLKSWKEKAELNAQNEISTSKVNDSNTDTNFQMLFFELLKQQELILDEIVATKRKTNSGKILSEENLKGRLAIKAFFEVLRVPFRNEGNFRPTLPKESIPNECINFFDKASNLVQYFKFNKQVLSSLKSESLKNNVDMYINIFKSKYSYYEKILLIYYLLVSEDKEYLNLVNEFGILAEIKREDLFYEEGYGLI